MQCFVRGMQVSVLTGTEKAHESAVGSDTGSPASLRLCTVSLGGDDQGTSLISLVDTCLHLA